MKPSAAANAAPFITPVAGSKINTAPSLPAPVKLFSVHHYLFLFKLLHLLFFYP
jgi:hypothetical protein